MGEVGEWMSCEWMSRARRAEARLGRGGARNRRGKARRGRAVAHLGLWLEGRVQKYPYFCTKVPLFLIKNTPTFG